MAKLEPTNVEFILQLDIIDKLLPAVGKEQWQTLYLSRDEDPHRFGMWCALLDNEAAARALGRESWDLGIGDGKPGFSQSCGNGEEITTYHRFGGHDGIRSLVLYRTFSGAFPKYCEIDEEFRLYHDLAEDKTRGLLLAFDSSGREIEVVRVAPQHVSARLKHLRQFQAGTGLHLAIYVDSVRFSQVPLEDIPDECLRRVERSAHSCWRCDVAKPDFKREYQTFSRLLGKVILPPPPRDRAGIWPFEDDDNEAEVSFIININENGDSVEYTSNPDALSNYFGANPGTPHYLTPVYFRREVMAKYFAEPERYKVSDGRLSCLALWSCQIDNDLGSHVVVFLGDLGRDLPYEERLHWRQFNIPPEGEISATNFRRSFLAQWANAEALDLVFKQEYVRLGADWYKKYGWPIFLPLSPGDAHLMDTIRIPVTNSQGEMDEQVLHLTKLLVDSLNEKELTARVGGLEEGTKGIGKLDAFFHETGFDESEMVLQFLRDIQLLRSTGSGHRKGSAYEKIVTKLGIDPTRKPDAVERLLEEAVAALRVIRLFYIND